MVLDELRTLLIDQCHRLRAGNHRPERTSF